MAKFPPKRIAFWGSLLGKLIYWTNISNKMIVRNNLKLAYPDWSQRKILEFTKAVFRNFGILLMEIAQLSGMETEDILTHCHLISSPEPLHRALQNGKGVILISAHLGNWEIGLQGLVCYFNRPLKAVDKRLSQANFYRWLSHVRKRFGTQMIEKENAFPEMLNALRQGSMLCLMMDISRRKGSVCVKFFGHRARATHVATLLSMRSGAPIFPVFSYRDGYGKIAGEIGPEIFIRKSGNLRDDLEYNTQIITNAVEKAIRKHPEQYFWIQKRWKHYHPYLYPDRKGHRANKREMREPRISISSGKHVNSPSRHFAATDG